MLARVTLAAALASLFFAAAAPQQAAATPGRIIILRHGEKADTWKLCATGQSRAAALAENYLGRGAANSLFPAGGGPDAFIAITLHTAELASPAAASWNLPLFFYTVIPEPAAGERGGTEDLNARTQQAVHDLMSNSDLDGTTVVMAWEHHHIADAKLEKEFPDAPVTLRQLLKLDGLEGVPETWPDETYDYFWIVDYGEPGADAPTAFHMVKQTFPKPFDQLPANDWGAPDGLTAASGCEK